MRVMQREGRLYLAVVAAALAGVSSCASRPRASSAPNDGAAWVATWSASQQLTEPRNMPPAPGLRGSTLRQVVHVSLGGQRLRMHVSNAFGDAPVTITQARLARSTGGGAIAPETSRALRFAGRADVTIPAGGAVV